MSKNHAIRLAGKIWGPNLKNRTRLLNYLKWVNQVISMNVHTYPKHNQSDLRCFPDEWIEWITIWMDWTKKMYLCVPNHMQKVYFIHQLILQILLTPCFVLIWACLTTPTWNDWINLLLLLVSTHMQKPTS